MSKWKTTVTESLDCDLPIVSAPMGGVAGGHLAAAVTQAGGLGLIGAGYNDAKWIQQAFDEAGEARVGIGFITWHMAQQPEVLEAALEREPPAVMLSFGDPAPFVPKIHAAGAKAIVQVQTVTDARRAVVAGADLIVAQGSEAGGHGAARGTFGLVPTVVDEAAPRPVLAAGGVVDGRSLAAAFMMGAAGVLVGTRLYASLEAVASDTIKQRLVTAQGDETLRTRVFDIVRGLDWPAGYTGRAVRNAFTERWHGREDDLRGDLAKQNAAYRAGVDAGDPNTAVVWASEGIDRITAIEPASQIVWNMVEEAGELLRDAPRYG